MISDLLGDHAVVTRDERMAQFICDRPPDLGATAEVLCEDHVGTYTLPFLCRWTEGGWTSAVTGLGLDVAIVGWRFPPARREGRPRGPGRDDL